VDIQPKETVKLGTAETAEWGEKMQGVFGVD